jgi:hypothetical protein
MWDWIVAFIFSCLMLAAALALVKLGMWVLWIH